MKQSSKLQKIPRINDYLWIKVQLWNRLGRDKKQCYLNKNLWNTLSEPGFWKLKNNRICFFFGLGNSLILKNSSSENPKSKIRNSKSLMALPAARAFCCKSSLCQRAIQPALRALRFYP